jgi:hypothetical protein
MKVSLKRLLAEFNNVPPPSPYHSWTMKDLEESIIKIKYPGKYVSYLFDSGPGTKMKYLEYWVTKRMVKKIIAYHKSVDKKHDK